MQTSTLYINLPGPNPLMPHYWNQLQCVYCAVFAWIGQGSRGVAHSPVAALGQWLFKLNQFGRPGW